MTRCPRCRGAAWERGGDVEWGKPGSANTSGSALFVVRPYARHLRDGESHVDYGTRSPRVSIWEWDR